MKLVLLLVLFCVPAFGGSDDEGAVLVKGAIYYDSEATLREVQPYILLKDNKSIKHMTELGHISEPTPNAQNILVLQGGHAPNDPVEFVFDDDSVSTSYWTYGRFVSERTTPNSASSSSPIPSPSAAIPAPSASPRPSTPSPAPSASPRPSTPSPTPSATPSPTASPSVSQSKRGAPGRKVWRTLPDGSRKWHYENYGPGPKPTD
jgi:hypothetical protein